MFSTMDHGIYLLPDPLSDTHSEEADEIDKAGRSSKGMFTRDCPHPHRRN